MGKQIARAGSPRPPSVILSAAKNLSPGRAQILSAAKDDNSVSVNASGACPRSGSPSVLGDEDPGPIVGWKLALGVACHADDIRFEQVYLCNLLHGQPGYVVD